MLYVHLLETRMRQNAGLKSQVRCFRDACIHMRNRPQLSCQADLTEHQNVIADLRVLQAGNQRHGHRKIRRRLVQAQAADNVHVGVQIRKIVARFLLQDRQKKRHSVIIKTGSGSSGVAKTGGSCKTLNLCQNRSGSFHNARHTRTRYILGPTG